MHRQRLTHRFRTSSPIFLDLLNSPFFYFCRGCSTKFGRHFFYAFSLCSLHLSTHRQHAAISSSSQNLLTHLPSLLIPQNACQNSQNALPWIFWAPRWLGGRSMPSQPCGPGRRQTGPGSQGQRWAHLCRAPLGWKRLGCSTAEADLGLLTW